METTWLHLRLKTTATSMDISDDKEGEIFSPPTVSPSPQAPKLQANTVSKLKKQFLEDYPSEVLSPDTMPSSRLLSMAFQHHSKREYPWIPWRYRMSQSKMDDMVIYHKPKVPRIEGLQLHQLLLDEPPALGHQQHWYGSERDPQYDGISTTLRWRWWDHVTSNDYGHTPYVS